MASHLTNTSQQTDRGEAGVRLLDELVGSPILQYPTDNVVDLTFTAEDVKAIVDQIADILADIFKAAIQSPIHFQVFFSFLSFSGNPRLIVRVSRDRMPLNSTVSTSWSHLHRWPELCSTHDSNLRSLKSMLSLPLNLQVQD
jgi:hypothetical protein